MNSNNGAYHISDLVEALKKMQEKHGDLEVVVATQDGGSYQLWSENDLGVVESYNPETGETARSYLQIG